MSLEITTDACLTWFNEKGKLNREKGPAVISPNGCMEFISNNQFHRLDGPAFIFSDGSKEYWIHSKKYYTKEAYYAKVRKL